MMALRSWICGPGGVGKTALMHALGEAAADADVPAVHLDVRTIEPSPPAFMAGLARALGLRAEASAREALAGGEPAVLLLDTHHADEHDRLLSSIDGRSSRSHGWHCKRMIQRIADRPTLVRTAVAAVTAWVSLRHFHGLR